MTVIDNLSQVLFSGFLRVGARRCRRVALQDQRPPHPWLITAGSANATETRQRVLLLPSCLHVTDRLW